MPVKVRAKSGVAKAMAKATSKKISTLVKSKRVVVKPKAKKTTTKGKVTIKAGPAAKKTTKAKIVPKKALLKTEPKTKPKTTPKVKPKAAISAAKEKPIKKQVEKKELKKVGIGVFERYQSKKNEKYMSKKMLDHFREVLLTWKQQLAEEVDRTVHHMQNEATIFPDPSDRATQEEEFSLGLRACDRDRKLINKIDESIKMIDEGVYGFCDECGEDIGRHRLEARPTATLCVDCKTLAEIREKQNGV